MKSTLRVIAHRFSRRSYLRSCHAGLSNPFPPPLSATFMVHKPVLQLSLCGHCGISSRRLLGVLSFWQLTPTVMAAVVPAFHSTGWPLGDCPEN